MTYEALNRSLLELIPRGACRILDLGCGSGALARALRERMPESEICGVTYSPAEAEVARPAFDRLIVSDIATLDGAALGRFDLVCCSHVLEHLAAPERTLGEIRTMLAPDGVLAVALPNILHWRQRVKFLFGSFAYTDGGPLDRTHLRFYDRRSARALLEGSGFRIIEQRDDGNAPLPFVRKPLGETALAIDRAALRVLPGLLAAQFLFICRARI